MEDSSTGFFLPRAHLNEVEYVELKSPCASSSCSRFHFASSVSFRPKLVLSPATPGEGRGQSSLSHSQLQPYKWQSLWHSLNAWRSANASYQLSPLLVMQLHIWPSPVPSLHSQFFSVCYKRTTCKRKAGNEATSDHL